jgi:cytochrome c553
LPISRSADFPLTLRAPSAATFKKDLESGMKFRRTLLALGLSFAAAAITVTHAEGNAANGKVLAYTCHGCHGIPEYKNAYPMYSVPKLGGQHAAYLQAALQEYAAQARSHPTMFAQASTLSEQDRADIAAYLATTETAKSTGPVVGTPPAVTQTCVACHGNNGVSGTEIYPTLAGQYQDYLVQILHDYRSGKRKNPIMEGFAKPLKDADIEAIAKFFSQQSALCSTDEIRKHGKCD